MKKLHIAVNTRMLLKDRLDGIGWFALQTLKRITEKHAGVDFTFLFDRPFDKSFIFGKNVTPLVVHPPTRHPFLYYIWFQYSIKSILKKIKPDLFLSPDGLLSLGAECPQLAVIHDINFKHFPNDLPFWYSKFFNHFFPKYASAAKRIAVVSEYTKQDLINEYEIDANKIDVIYSGADEGFRPIDENLKKNIKEKYTAGKDYFIFVGSVHPRKNIPKLLQAFDEFKKEKTCPANGILPHGGDDLKLVIAGSFFWGKTEIYKTLGRMKFQKDVIFTGRVNDEDLRQLTAAAYCLTYVPYFEGFGVPLVEAMRSEIPIIAANVTSLPEIAGKAAIYVNPFNVEEIKNAMLRIHSDDKLRNDLIENGKIQRQKFSWDKTADLLWQSIEKTLS